MIDYKKILNENNENRRNSLKEDGGEIALKAGVFGAILLAAFGIKSCNDNIADKSLQQLGCLENYEKFNLDGDGSISKSIGIGDTQSKAMYAAVVSYAREHDVSIDQAAREITGDVKERLKTDFKDNNSILNFKGRVTGVSILRDPESGERIVRVDSEWREAHTSGSGEHRHTYYTTEHGTVYIPMSEGNIYGIDKKGNSTVINGVEYVLEESWKDLRIRDFV